MDDIQWQVFDDAARDNIDKDYVYHIRTKEGAEYSGMYPNYAGFHCQNPGEPRRVDMSDVTHYAIQMTFDDHADKYVFKRG
ncbi:hypothetical protein pEaSNUABM40_00002 [Erwinia phage pEa_SNUABM_40]|uniref:Uncharacterized protein n=1 Tax=Erwinia phage pEa_SNUABM_3 TaxID=2869552 RepID=A0AAE8BYF9_9CAUD|nr:hypothetical protein MPK68_gp002 [Erwinia phage pEa_SNUABM_3]QZE56538.1 hypothetical protein pEaSNUABM20_00002 [Erwinia phage pEa_SNUABM_20]QZE58218.1 hypothetical protein pEaSNUABM40_00002 [Erwinia phage pEa_SNUABM_40]UAW52784.1 hypothetical protein pEaSNUABM23_00002 [Erwinia phage pEa_SNUABM_23]UIW10680.1 hypothetical protein pEaSNUABM23_00002 [Erwinia phage pEa_SNUABM_31]QZE56199.1 hypothetical protein pEaSNUABM3_00002 [Erwinia phage pEa_SNUABM_3]